MERGPTMNKAKFLFAFLLTASVAAQAVEIKKVIVRQQWPWSSDIKVEYVLSGVTVPVDIGVTVLRDGAEVELPANSVRGDLYGVAQSQIGTITIDAAKVFGADKVKTDDLKVQLSLSDSEDDINEALYKIFDLASGACEDVTRKDLLNGRWGTIETSFAAFGPGFKTGLQDVLVWTGVTNNPIYKTDKLVMRKVHAAGVTWQSGDPPNYPYNNHASLSPQHWIKLTYDYYIAVFELTQAQYKKVQGSLYGTNCEFTDVENADWRPVNYTFRYNIHGHPKPETADARGVVSGEPIQFPTNSYVRDVGGGTFCSRLWTKTGWEFNLPTGAEWEFACRAGSDGVLYTGEAHNEANITKIAWAYWNAPDGIPQVVGQKAPNAFGLYDMLGNVLEHSNYAGEMNQGAVSGTGDSEDDPAINPVGKTDTKTSSTSATGTTYWSLGGAPCDAAKYFGYWYDGRISARYDSYEWYTSRNFLGTRLVCPVEKQWAQH